MTTTIKPLRRETLSTHRGRPLVIELRSTYVTLRRKGTRLRYQATYDQLWTLGARNAAEEIRRERAAKKAERRKAK